MKIQFSISTSNTPTGVQALVVRRKGGKSKPMFIVLKGNKIEVAEFANGLNRDSVGKFSDMENFLDLHYPQIRVFGTEYAFVRVSPSASFNYTVHGQPNQWDWASMDDDDSLDDEAYSSALFPEMRSLSLSETSISDMVRQGKTLNAAQKESLINLLCKGARGNTRIDVTSMVKYGNIAKWQSVGISTDRIVFTGDVAEYVAGQSYPDEIKNIRRALTKMRKG